MPTEILMPALSPTMEEGKLAKWLVSEGQAIKPGDIIAEIETDKATMEVEAVDEGKVSRLLIPAGTEGVKVNTPIAVLDGDSSAKPISASRPAPEGTRQSDGRAAYAEVKPAPSAPMVVRAAEPEIAPGTETVSQTMREALRDAMAEEMRRDPDVFLMGEEVAQYQGAYKISQGLLEEFGPKRVIDTPITEQGFAGVGVGAAMAGLKPIVEFMTWNFAMQAIDQIINSAAKTLYMSGGQLGCPIVFRGPNGAAARVAAQHSQCFSSWYAHVPGMKVVAPSNAADAKGLLKAAIRDDNPVCFMESEIMYSLKGEVPTGELVIPLGVADVKRPGRDVTLVTWGKMLHTATKAADELATAGIEVEVLDLRTIRPLDTETVLASVAKTNRAVVLEEGWTFAGVGAQVVDLIQREAFDELDAPVIRVTGADVPMPYNKQLEKVAKADPAKVGGTKDVNLGKLRR
jgi:pyruvate dehydrogenase E1 component beta subunit